MKIALIIMGTILALAFFPYSVIIAMPFALIYAIYRAIKGLMKYHHELTQQDTTNHQREP